MDHTPKKSDLSDLKARLGLKSGPDQKNEPASGGGAGAAAPLPASPAPTPAPAVPPPAGAVPASAPAASRDPFAVTAPVRAAAAPIVDTGPPIDIPEEKKRPTKSIVTLLAIGLVALVLGWAFGRVYGDRVEFNRSVDDAKQISDEVGKLASINQKLAGALVSARKRNRAIIYDQQLIEELTGVLGESPSADPKRLELQQERLFRTNYRRMADVVAPLLKFYAGTIRLLQLTKGFTKRSTDNKDELEKYVKAATKGTPKNYGLVVSDDRGSFFIGSLVEIGKPDCKNKRVKPEECGLSDIAGFQVRVGNGQNWQSRPGKPKRGVRLEDIVIPINVRDETWRQVAVGHPGYLAFRAYVRRFRDLELLAAQLEREQKQLIKKLETRATQDKMFAPI